MSNHKEPRGPAFFEELRCGLLRGIAQSNSALLCFLPYHLCHTTRIYLLQLRATAPQVDLQAGLKQLSKGRGYMAFPGILAGTPTGRWQRELVKEKV